MNIKDEFHHSPRIEAAKAANEEDAVLWRWFSALIDEGRLRWCRSSSGWLVSVDHKHVATEPDFDSAIRAAKSQVSVVTELKKQRSRRVKIQSNSKAHMSVDG
ncbi:hypothetical protein C0Z16_31780 [Paraburkholderia rhynchosiae]|uniref:Uncharacterized protein n=1 Tax=Paraburkholderia rhynchosiae TaxID=487049 RepID=A0ABX4UVM5_9BURK|nr:hypothetical protein C0Z16_31780 [Paraburkholderia rhynchosiae]